MPLTDDELAEVERLRAAHSLAVAERDAARAARRAAQDVQDELVAACQAAIVQIARLMPFSTGDEEYDVIVEAVGDRAQAVIDQIQAAIDKADVTP